MTPRTCQNPACPATIDHMRANARYCSGPVESRSHRNGPARGRRRGHDIRRLDSKMHGKDSRCACGCGRSMSGLRGNAKYALSRCSKQQRAPLTADEKEWAAIIAHDPCTYCGRVGDHWRPTIGADHIEPLSKGGAADPTNMAPACQFCNSSKGALDALRYMLSRFDNRWRGEQ